MKHRQVKHNTYSGIGHSVLCAVMFLFLSALVSCSMMDNDTADCDNTAGNTTGNAKTFLTVKVQIGDDDDATSRADGPGPEGGEDGDENELGFDNENLVKDLTLVLFKYNDGKNKPTDTDTEPIYMDDAFYFDNFQPSVSNKETDDSNKNKYYQSSVVYAVDPKYFKSNYYFFVTTNSGDKTSHYKDKRFMEIANEVIACGWLGDDGAKGISGKPSTKETIVKYSDFVMSNDQTHSTYQSSEITGSGTEDDPFIVFAKVKRLAARIDFLVDNKDKKQDNAASFVKLTVGDENTAVNGYSYPVQNSTGTANGRFVLTHVMPFNCLNSGSYFVEHTFNPSATNSDDVFGYIDKETSKVINGYIYTGNYVLDPWTEINTTSLYALKADTHTSDLYTNYLSKDVTSSTDLFNADKDWQYKWDDYKIREADQQVISKVEKNDDGTTEIKYANNKNYYILTYTNENTAYPNGYDHATGLLFRGRYFTADEWNSGSPSTTGTEKVYKYYIRHSDPEDKFNTTGNPSDDAVKAAEPMLYGIVRNNIYRVSIDGVTIDEETGLKITPKIQVRKWATYTHEAIYM